MTTRRGTGLYRKVATAPGIGVVLPDLPERGETSMVGWDFPWEAYGGQEHTDIFELAEDEINLNPREENVPIDPPLAPNATGVIPIKIGIETFSFAAYTVDDVVFAISSTSQLLENGMITESPVFTYKTCALEITGKGVLYFPKVRIKPGVPAGGIKAMVKVTFECQVFGTSDLPSGWGFAPFDEEAT